MIEDVIGSNSRATGGLTPLQPLRRLRGRRLISFLLLWRRCSKHAPICNGSAAAMGPENAAASIAGGARREVARGARTARVFTAGHPSELRANVRAPSRWAERSGEPAIEFSPPCGGGPLLGESRPTRGPLEGISSATGGLKAIRMRPEYSRITEAPHVAFFLG